MQMVRAQDEQMDYTYSELVCWCICGKKAFSFCTDMLSI
jgi:hypothetical protein